MKALRTWLLALFLMGCVLATPALAADTVASGTCGAEGDNLTWTLDSEGVLTISGTGAMEDYSSYRYVPWYANCDSIKTVSIGSGVTSVGTDAFFYCRNLTGVMIPDSVTSIGDFAFQNCSSLTDITIPKSVTSIGGSAFRNCSSLTDITIPERVTCIGVSAFDNCSSLSSLTLGGGLTSIGSSAFQSCSSLTDVTIPDSVTSIGVAAFYNCSNLQDVNVTSMDAWCRIAFGDRYATPMFYAKNFCLNGEKVVSVAVPQGVTVLEYTFYGFKDLIQVTLPSSMTRIGEQAFRGCSSLVSITIPDSVTSIGDQAFYGCSSLARITIGSGVVSIGREAFRDCSSLVNITIPDSVASIGGGAFDDCSSLSSISIGSGVTSIGMRAFDGCRSLTDVFLTDMDAWCRIDFEDYASTPMYYAEHIYLNGEEITSVEMPQGITVVQSCAFYCFPDLVTVIIPDSVTSIDWKAFWYCTSLQSIAIGSGVTSIGDSAFYKCNKLESVYITDMAAWCGIAFENDYANPLYYAKNLYLNGAKVETLEIPEGVQVIAKNAFVNATCIQGVAIPKSLVGVAANAFTGCSGIAKVYYAGSETEWKDLAISAGNDPLTNAQIFYNATADDYYCRITVKISDGGRIFVDRNTAAAGETVTITTAPYAGYELSALYVDGTAIEGNSFPVTGNHVVSARFTKLPVTGGTQDYRMEGITVQTAEGEKLQELTAGKLLVSVSVRHLQGTEGATILLAQYDAQGRYQGLLWLTLDEMPLDMALKVTLPVDNSDGKIVHLKAFVVDSLLSAVPVGSAVSFGDV